MNKTDRSISKFR